MKALGLVDSDKKTDKNCICDLLMHLTGIIFTILLAGYPKAMEHSCVVLYQSRLGESLQNNSK